MTNEQNAPTQSSKLMAYFFDPSIWTALTAFLGAGAAAAGVWAFFLTRDASAKKDDELQRFQTSSMAEIAKANARAEEAKATASSAQAETARFNEIAERERLARLKLEEKLRPRSLSPTEAQGVTLAIRPFAGTTIDVIKIGDGAEIAGLSLRLATVLNGAGWRVRGTWTSMGGLSGTGVALSLAHDAPETTSNAAHALILALRNAGVDAGLAPAFADNAPPGGGVMGPDWGSPSKLRLFIGEKP